MLQIEFARPKLPESGALALLVAEGAAPSGLWAAADEATGGAVSRAFDIAAFAGRKGQSCTILAPAGGLTRIVAIGLGKPDELTRLALENAGGAAAAALTRETTAALATDGLSGAQAAQAAFGATLRAYRFDRYRTKEKPEDKPLLTGLTLLSADPEAAEAAWTGLQAVANGVCLTRDLVSEPPNVLKPAEMARRCEALRELGLTVSVLEPEELSRLGFGMLLGVAQGSLNPPRVVIMRWSGAGGSGQPIAFIGKGVTFDSGGISIKPAGGMEEMKYDMAGAGAVIGVMAALAGRRAKVEAIGIVGLVENMLSGDAQRPGDVVRSYSGQTVEVVNTDAEGRLVLGDLIWYCQEKFDPKYMIDLATLTGAIIVGLGHEHAGLFASDDHLAETLLAAGIQSGDTLWRMPLAEGYDKLLRSDIADMKNVGGRPGGACTAAHFIKRFTNGKPWAHLDIAGTAWASKDSATAAKGATGYGVRLLDRFADLLSEG
jgi:leucyl aminopeptidase